LRIALVHAFFDDAGGNERLALDMYRALRELGHEVDLYAAHVNEGAWRALTGDLREAPRPITIKEPLASRLAGRALALRSILATSGLVRGLKGSNLGYDVVLDTYSNVPMRWVSAAYVHFPTALLLDFHRAHRRLGLHERLYYGLVGREARRLASRRTAVMTNSAWTAEHVTRAYGSQRIYVVHPPVNIEELSTLGGDKGRIVLTVSGMYPEKNVLAIADVARLVPEAEFYLVGATGPASGPVVRELKRRAEGLNNFHLETDVPRKRIIELMSQASVYLHPPFAEHFGIAIAEAAAAGLVPVVYRDGGGWTDIASRIDEGLGYTNIEEAAHIIRSLLNDPERLKALSVKAREVAKGFSYERFKERVNEVVKLIKEGALNETT
jgi:Glycosyltransferase